MTVTGKSSQCKGNRSLVPKLITGRVENVVTYSGQIDYFQFVRSSLSSAVVSLPKNTSLSKINLYFSRIDDCMIASPSRQPTNPLKDEEAKPAMEEPVLL